MSAEPRSEEGAGSIGPSPEERFRERHGYERGRIAKYKERRRYGRLSAAAMFVGFFALLGLAWAVDAYPVATGALRNRLAVGFAVLLFVAATGFWLLSYYLLWRSGLTNEAVAYYEFARAMDAYERNDLPAVVSHLGEVGTHLTNAHADRISDGFRRDVVGYVDAVRTAKNPELAVRETFEPFSAAVVDGVLGPRVDVAPLIERAGGFDPGTSQLDGLRRAVADARDVLASGMFGFWGGVVLAFALGALVFRHHDPAAGAGLLGALLTGYGVYLRNLG